MFVTSKIDFYNFYFILQYFITIFRDGYAGFNPHTSTRFFSLIIAIRKDKWISANNFIFILFYRTVVATDVNRPTGLVILFFPTIKEGCPFSMFCFCSLQYAIVKSTRVCNVECHRDHDILVMYLYFNNWPIFVF